MPLRVAALLLIAALCAGGADAQELGGRFFSSDGYLPSQAWRGDGRFSRFGGGSAYERPQPWGRTFNSVPFDVPPPPRHTAYRTLCVRMCDGYYFPVSYATDTGGLAHDAQACTAACGSEARLFYHPNPGGNIAGMVDLTGRTYASYPTAFRYRKTLVEGCQCRPQPWSHSEAARHRSYAATQSRQPPGQVAQPSIADAFGNVPSSNDSTEPWVGNVPPAALADFDSQPFAVAPAPSPGWDMLSGFSTAPPPRSRHVPSAGW